MNIAHILLDNWLVFHRLLSVGLAHYVDDLVYDDYDKCAKPNAKVITINDYKWLV